MVSVTKHEKNLRELRCAVTRSPFITLHHCHGGSMKDMGWHVGMGQKQNPFLQIPLKHTYHVGDLGIDSGYGVERWEKDFGRQWDHLIWVNDQLPYNLFAQAVRWEEKNRPNTTTGKSNMTDTSSIP
jgi:hypothetical protein